MKVVKVLWVDSCNSNMNWTVSEDIEVEPMYIDSFGVVVKDTDEFLAIAQNYGDDPEQYSNITTIPKGCIKEVFVMHEDKNCEMNRKSTEVEPKFHKDEWVIDNKNRTGVVTRILKEHYIISFDGREEQVPFVWQSRIKSWTIQDAKDGDVLADDYGIYIFEKFDECDKNCFVCNGAYQYSQKVYECEPMLCSTDVHPATKEQRDTLMRAMADAGYTFEKKALKKFVTPIFHIGDRVRYKGHSCDGVITEITNTDYICGDAKLPISTQDKLELVEKNPTWSKEDEKNSLEIKCLIGNYRTGDDEYRLESWIDNLKDRVQPKQEWSEIDMDMLESIIKDSTQRNSLDPMQLCWLDSLTEKHILQPKQELSEEDEKAINIALSLLRDQLSENKNPFLSKRYAHAIKILKSLRPQKQWNLSDEQIEALNYYLKYHVDSDGVFGRQLVKLYQDLKKLRGK